MKTNHQELISQLTAMEAGLRGAEDFSHEEMKAAQQLAGARSNLEEAIAKRAKIAQAEEKPEAGPAEGQPAPAAEVEPT